MANTNDFWVQLLAKLDTSSANADFEKLKKRLTSDPIVQKFTLDTSMSKQAIKTMASEIHNELGKVFQHTGIEEFNMSVHDIESILSSAVAESNKLAKELETASSKAEKFLARFNNKSGGTLINSQEYKDVRKAIDGLGKTHSIDQLNVAMNTLETTYNNMVASLRNSGKSLNPFISAKNEMATMDDTIKGISLEFEKLISKPEDVAKAIKGLSGQKKEVEKHAIGTQKWADEYGKLQKMIQKVRSELSNLQKAQSAKVSTQIFKIDDLKKDDIAYMSKVYKTIEKQQAEINRMAKAKGWNIIDISGVEEADGKIKKLTLTVRDAEGSLKKFDMQREKLQGKGKAQYGLMQVGDVKVLETSAKEQARAIESVRKEQDALTDAMARGREKAEQARIAEEKASNKRQQLAAANAVNKELEEEYKQRQKNIEVTKKQAELDRQNALAFTKSASKRLSSAISKYSYGDTSDANAMMKQMNRGLSNFGDLSNVQGNITQLSSTVDKIIADLKLSHEQSLQALNEEIKAEQTLQSQKDAFNKKNINAIDYEIQKREEEAKTFSSMLQAQMQEQQKVQSKVNEIQLLSNGGVKNDYATQIAQLEGNFRRLGLSQEEVSQKTSKVSTAFGELKTRINQPFDESNYQEIINLNDVLQRELIESSNEYTRLQASFKGFATEQQRLSLANTIEAWNQKNSAATRDVIDANQRYILSLRDLSNEMLRVDFDRINTGFKQNENSMRAMNRLGKSLKEQFKQAYQSFTMWLSASSAVMKIISETREAFAELREINTLLTEISKANDKLTKEQLTQIGNNSFDVASKYGKSASDFLKGVQEASRAGYENAEAMAELSTAAQGAGDMTSEVANQFIIATDKAYKLNGSVTELTKVLDGVNYITNHNAVNMTELSEAMTIVGSTAASFGVETNELTAALGTMSATTQQSGSEVARAFRAILLNIRQVSDEEEGIDVEGLTKYEKACNALGVSLKETRNGVLQTRDAMDVLKDLSVEYNKLEENDLRRTELLNSVGGKLRATQLDALLRQWSMYEEMLQQFEDGNGSMQKEAEKTANSWEGVATKVSNTWNDTVENVANSDAIITILNRFNDLLQIVNKVTDALGSFGTIGLGAGVIAGFKNAGICV